MKINSKNLEQLKSGFERGRLAQAYLFCGPAGTGKLEMIFDFVRLVNRTDYGSDKIIQGFHPDIFFIAPVEEVNKGKKRIKDISIEQFQPVFDKIGLFAYQAEYKFLIVHRAEKMTAAAANSILKLIEEPPEKTIILLSTDNEDAVLATIRSRCQRVWFGLQQEETIREYLAEKYRDFSLDEIAAAAELAHGRVGKAEAYLQDPQQRQDAEETVQQFRLALRQGLGKGMALAAQLSGDRHRLMAAMEEWIWYLGRFQVKLVRGKADRRMQKKTLDILQQLLKVYNIIKGSNASDKLQLENFFVSIG